MKRQYILFVSAIATLMSLTSCDTLLALDGGSVGTVYSTGGAVYDAGYGVGYGANRGYASLNYEQARQQALFLSAKMAYELGLNELQYEAIYEINLDYLLNMRGESSLYGDLWALRNTDLFYVLSPQQYNYFVNMDYFYRPVYWYNDAYVFSIYSRYDNPRYYYRSRPSVYSSYRGGHSRYGNSYYAGRFGRRDGSPVVINRGNFANDNSRYSAPANTSRYNSNTSSFGNQQRRNGGTYGQGSLNSQQSRFGTQRRNDNSNRNSTFGVGNRKPNNNNSQFGNDKRNWNNSTFERGNFNKNNTNNSSFGGNRSSFGGNRSSFGGSNRSSFGSGSSNSKAQPNTAPNGKSNSGGSFGGHR